MKTTRRARKRGPEGSETIGHLIEHIAPGIGKSELLAWPADAFAIGAFVLQKTGAYLKVVKCGEWPPKLPARAADLVNAFLKEVAAPTVDRLTWTEYIHAVGWAWRFSVEKKVGVKGRRLVRTTVEAWIDEILRHRFKASRSLDLAPDLVDCWLQLLAAADEAFAGVGFSPQIGEPASVDTRAFYELWNSANHSTLCTRAIREEIAGVIPKVHTPQTGITLRSLSHYLAFYRTAEVRPKWHTLISSPFGTYGLKGGEEGLKGEVDYRDLVRRQSSINILFAPWPETILPKQFRPARWSLANSVTDRFGFFEFASMQPPRAKVEFCRRMKALRSAAETVVGRIDGIVLPELALEGEDVVKALSNQFLRHNPEGFFVAGVGSRGRGGKPGTNRAYWGCRELGDPVLRSQAKHHRWQLDRRQIENFGLGGTLNPSLKWWEHIELASRSLAFMAFSPWFTTAVLVCEDLARQEPISELIRAVGPNLVIALLMDGPQLANRWPGRYATSLADDPGCSVLSVTSLGMAELSRPAGIDEPNRTVALWKDPVNGVREIKLPCGAAGLVLSLSHTLTKEFSADGRHDGETSSYLSLSGVHPIVVRKDVA